MSDDFKKLKLYVMRLNTVVGELESLEDFVDVDYGDVKTDVGYCTVLLEQRRERLQKRGRTQQNRRCEKTMDGLTFDFKLENEIAGHYNKKITGNH